ncbi:hypothetical protein BLNAU_15447 [Blattamonas nauphoetae]|uniref:Right handed beta helix domain-containing protein n=1 Tax=Blattamonas nauphoetae TaxID=2049346 RepID=A0ABQ9XG23_9EUKA|nr:hypothetical protein BLNAU_15447 [Blattamonas nauphoetae]
MLVSVVLFNQDQELQAPPLILTEKIHHFHNLAFLNENKTISSLQVPTILGMHTDTSMLFELHNSTVKVWHVVALIDMEYGIADLQDHSSFELHMSTIRFESENTPFCADTGTVTLSSVTIEGSSLIPQLFQSSEHGSALNVIGCSVSDVSVGVQAILSADRTTIKITNSHFSHIEHVFQESTLEPTLPESSRNAEEYPLESFTTIFFNSIIANVTDDLYGTITSAPMRGESFMFSGLTCTQQTLRPLSLFSSPTQFRNTEQVAQSDIEIRDCKFENGSDIHKSGSSGLFLRVSGSRKVNITNCAFVALESPSGVSGLHIDASMPTSGQSPQITISKCSFTNCIGRTTTKLDLIHTAASLWACEWTNSSSKDGVLRVRGSSPKMWTGPGLVLGRCALTDCTGQSDTESKSGCVDVVYDGPISLANQTTVENCVGDSAAAIVVGSIVSVECSRFVHSTSKSTFISAGYICGWQVSMKNVLISKCASCDARHSLVLSLFWKPSLTEMEDAPIESNYLAENVFVKRGKNKVGMEILYSVPETLLLDERLNPTQFKKVHSDSKTGTVASTTTKVDPLDSHVLDIQDVEYTDETLEILIDLLSDTNPMTLEKLELAGIQIIKNHAKDRNMNLAALLKKTPNFFDEMTRTLFRGCTAQVRMECAEACGLMLNRWGYDAAFKMIGANFLFSVFTLLLNEDGSHIKYRILVSYTEILRYKYENEFNHQMLYAYTLRHSHYYDAEQQFVDVVYDPLLGTLTRRLLSQHYPVNIPW